METQDLLSTPAQTKAYQDHKRQKTWQILFPVIFLSLVMVAVIVLLIITTGASGNTQDTHWANISLIWMLLPTIVASLIFLALLGGLVYLMAKLLKVTPLYAAKGQYYARRASEIARTLGDKAVSPILSVNSMQARWRSFRQQIRHMPKFF